VAFNFTALTQSGYRIGVPTAGTYVELLNTDSTFYGGRNQGNTGQVQTEPIPAHGFAQSLNLTLPPLAALFLKPEA
jgi:1,4-alpha-glucan branching enzyme